MSIGALAVTADVTIPLDTTLRGVLMEIMGVGVLLSGASGAGKSELALELITRGHRLVADDAPRVMRRDDGLLEGACPPALQDFLEVRGLGVINVRVMFGGAAVAPCSALTLVVHLQWMRAEELGQIDRLRPNQDMMEILGVAIPRIILPVAPGRPLATLCETAVRGHLLAMGGYDATADFAERQRSIMS